MMMSIVQRFFLFPLIAFLCLPRAASADEYLGQSGHGSSEHAAPADAILFPWFILIIGTVIYLVLSRYAKWLPYTAMCFLLGTLLGIASENRPDNTNLLYLSMSDWWINIDSEVLLLAFLPGLLYKDASSLNVHLVYMSLSQCFIMAFPMVLAGTTLIALVFWYIFPYDWSFNLCMTAGCILSATDPVAVAALLEAVGAPARLKTHIAGEALFNDGSAIVFFTIFGAQMYLSELGVPGLGQETDWASGIATFFRMSAGAVAVGMFFALGTIILSSFLDRRLEREENIVEVAMEITVAYMCYFVAEVAWGTSGVIATVTMGLMVNAFGRATFNDRSLRQDFLSLVEHMLNTVLFALGGLVWGSIISNEDTANEGREFTAQDWGYLILLYVFLMVVRYALFIICYPVISRIGLKSSIPEMIFQAYGGLRGAVGIALAISLDNMVRQAGSDDPKFAMQTYKLFGFVGGIAFMTLMINATTAGPILIKLKLAESTEVRKNILEEFERKWKAWVLMDMIRLLSTQVTYNVVNFHVVQIHVPLLADLNAAELSEAANAYREENKNSDNTSELNLEHILSSFQIEVVATSNVDDPNSKQLQDPVRHSEATSFLTTGPSPSSPRRQRGSTATMRRRSSLVRAETSHLELRLLFIELVRADYERQIQEGELTDRELVAHTLTESLELCADQVNKGLPLNDWDLSLALEMASVQILKLAVYIELVSHVFDLFAGPRPHVSMEYALTRLRVERTLAFTRAHKQAQVYFRNEFNDDEHFSRFGQDVLKESTQQVEKAEAYLLKNKTKDFESIVSHKFCSILLLNAARYVEEVAASGLLKSIEAQELLEEVQKALLKLRTCNVIHFEGEKTGLAPSTNAPLTKVDKIDEEGEEMEEIELDKEQPRQ